jgi:predicted phage terminase large subunit-like protein
MVSAKAYGRKQRLRIYVLPYPVNARLSFPKTVDRAKRISQTVGTNALAHLFIESTGYQKAVVDQLRSEGYPAEEYQTRGEDKRARLTTVTPLIQSGQILFPRKGANNLIEQLVGFGRERHDDLADAFAILVSKIIERDKIFAPKGYTQLISDYMLEQAYVENPEILGETRIGVVLADVGRTSSAIVVRGPKGALVYYREYDNNIVKLANTVIECARKYRVPMNETHIYLDRSGRGEELAEAIEELATNERLRRSYDYLQHYGHNMGDPAPHEEYQFHNRRAQAYWRLVEWLREGGKLKGAHDLDDLLSIYYTEESDRRIKIVSRQELEAEGVDASVPEALMLTFALEKTHNVDLRPQKQPPYKPWSIYEIS